MHKLKKYPNRRLYDMTDSRYVTMEDARELIVRGESIEVIDAKDDEHEKASEEWVKECSWHAVGLAFPAFRDDSGRLLEDPSERVSFLKSKRMLDRHAVALGQELMNLQAVTVEKADGDAADFFGGA